MNSTLDQCLHRHEKGVSETGPLPAAATQVSISFPTMGEIRVRRIISRSAPRPVTKYPSVRLGRTVHCESSLEVDVAELLDACPEVTCFGEQPLTVHYTQEGVPHRHVPDFVASSRDIRALIEVKFAKDVDSEVLKRTEFLAEALPALGYEYHLVTEGQVHRGAYLDNARYLLRRARPPATSTRTLEVYAQVRSAGELPFGSFASESDQAAVAHLLVDGRLTLPMATPVGPQTPVRLAEKGEGQPWVWALFN